MAGPPWRPAVDAGSPDTAAPSASIAIGRPATIRLATICRHANREDQPRVARRGSPPRISQRMSTRSIPRRCHPPGSRRGSDVAVLGTSDRPDRSTTSPADRTFAQRLSSVKNAWIEMNREELVPVKLNAWSLEIGDWLEIGYSFVPSAVWLYLREN